MEHTQKHKIDEELMDKIENLSMLKLSKEEREKTKAQIEQIISYVEVLNQLDTESVEDNIQLGGLRNCYRDDEVTNGDGAQDLLANAPTKYNNQIVVPKTIG